MFHGSGEVKVNLAKEQLASDARKRIWNEEERLEVTSR